MLAGRTLALRAVERSDLEALNAWWNDPALSWAIGARRHLSALEETEAWYDELLSRSEPHEGRTYAVCLVQDGRLVGTAWYGPFDPQDRNVEIGLYLGQPSDRGRGLGKEVLGLLVAYLFEDLAVHKVRLLVRADNEQALACFEKSGFKREGTLRQHRFLAGSHRDFIVMGMLSGERDAR